MDSIQKIKSNKSPGPDGITIELYKKFPFLALGLLKVWKSSIQKGQIPEDISTGVIALIYKKGSTLEIGNYRPITMLPIDYKIIATSLASQLKKVITSMVGLNQKGFIPGRNIKEIIIETFLALNFSKRNKQEGGIILFDFEKAFDRVDREYMFKCLQAVGCGSYFIKIIQVLHSQTKAFILINGYLSNPIQVQSGVRQGCPLAPLLFAICTEPLRILVLQSKIQGLKIKEIQLIISMYADDTTGFIGSLEDSKLLLECINTYCQASGAQLNNSKSKVLIFNKNFKIPNISSIEEEELESLLGSKIGHKMNNLDQYSQVLEKMNQKVLKLNSFSFSFIGKSLLINSVITSHLWYLAACTQTPISVIKDSQKLVWNFFYNKRTKTRIAYSTAQKTKLLGGMNIPNIESRIGSLKLSTIVKILLSGNTCAKLILEEIKYLSEKWKIKNILINKVPIILEKMVLLVNFSIGGINANLKQLGEMVLLILIITLLWMINHSQR